IDKILNTRGLAMSAPLPRQNRGYSVFQRKPAPDAIRGGDRFASRKRVKSRIWSPFRFDRNGKGTGLVSDVEEKGGKMLKEFSEFAMKGNVVDLAVGVIIGAAFGG